MEEETKNDPATAAQESENNDSENEAAMLEIEVAGASDEDFLE